jgi:predicted metalloprotease
VDEQRTPEGRKELVRFVRQVRRFGENGRFDQRVRRTERLVLGAALLGVALLLLTGCGGGTGSADISGSGDSNATPSNAASGTALSSPQSSATTASASAISQACQPPDMENCYSYEDMQAYADQIVPMVEQYFDDTYEPDLRHPTHYVYVSKGETGSTACGGDYTDMIYAYCFVDESIYMGQGMLWSLYSDAGDAAPAVGLAHEWGHHVQNIAGVPRAETSVGQISRENQADCIAGSWIAYADEQGWLTYPDDLADTHALLEKIAETEQGRTHGDLVERSDSLILGVEAGLPGCNDFFPDSPVAASASSLSAPSATASPSPSP